MDKKRIQVNGGSLGPNPNRDNGNVASKGFWIRKQFEFKGFEISFLTPAPKGRIDKFMTQKEKEEQAKFQIDIIEIIKKQKEDFEIFKEEIKKIIETPKVEASPISNDNEFIVGGRVEFLDPNSPPESVHVFLREVEPIMRKYKVVFLNINLHKKF